jgi:DNA invertase Pin-like site-specific DNA recombinase
MLPAMTKATKGTRVVGYCRVSSAEQAQNGVSLAAQRERLQAYAVAMELDLVAICEDAGVSAGTLNRPGLQAALAMLDAKKATGLVVVKLDRLTRSVTDLGALLRQYFLRRHDLLSVTDSIDTRSATGRLMLNLLTSVTAWEREQGGERTRAALMQLKAQRRCYGQIPVELRDSGKRDADGRRILVRDAAGSETLARARELRAGGASLRDVAATLTAEGRRTAKGGKWAAETVRLLLARAA